MSERRMRLTPELVALTQRLVSDPGPNPAIANLRDEDFRPVAAAVLAQKADGPFWLFAYGSLIWKPEILHEETRRALAKGWHRAFSMRIERFRGSPEQHGFMMCLDRGGSCEGMVLRLPDENQLDQMEKLIRRELSRKAALEAVRWIEVETDEGPLKALSFYAAPDQLDNYQAGRPLREIAPALARACGHWGSGADYLYNTVRHLEALGIHDEGLWALQDEVAGEIEALYG